MGYERFSAAFNKAQAAFSQQVKISYFDMYGVDTYDDAPNLVQSGNDLWVSGTVQSLDTTQGSTDSNLLEQGKLINNDTKVFINGSVMLTGSFYQVRVQLGSPTGDQYSLIPLGGINKQVNGEAIFKQIYVRRITNGSALSQPAGMDGGTGSSVYNVPMDGGQA